MSKQTIQIEYKNRLTVEFDNSKISEEDLRSCFNLISDVIMIRYTTDAGRMVSPFSPKATTIERDHPYISITGGESIC